MARVLVFRPVWEEATKYGNSWLGEIVRIAQTLGHQVLDLSGDNATQENLFKALEDFKPEILFLCSHGSSRQFSGQGGLIVFTACQNDEKMTGTQSMFLSCFDEETEILTADGFKPFRSITYNDLFITLNQKGFMEYQHPIAIQKYHYKGKMIYFKGKNYNLFVTPDHNMYCKHTQQKTFRFIKAEELTKKKTSLRNIELKRNANWEGYEIKTFRVPTPVRRVKHSRPIDVGDVPINLWLKFFAWYLSEGSTRERHDGAGRITITQSNEKNKQEILQLIKDLGFSPYIHQEVYIEFHSRQLHDYLNSFGKSHERFVPSWIKNLSSNKLRIFLETLIKGDGTKSGKHSYTFYTSSKKLADDIHEIALKAGFCVSIGIDNRKESDFGTYISSRRPLYILYISSGQATPQIETEPKIIDYNGMIYDITVPNHVIYVRRNGKAVWSGNCLVGQELLPSMDEKDAVTVAGYTAEFTWMINPQYANKPLEDPYAYPFMRAVVEPARSLLQGASWRQWYDITVRFFNLGVSEWWNSTDPYAAAIVAALEHDRDSLVVYGETAIRPLVAVSPLVKSLLPISIGTALILIFS